MKRLFLIYDDCGRPSSEIREITGGKSFGETIYKRKTLRDRMREELLRLTPAIGFYVLSGEEDRERLRDVLKKLPSETAVIHLFSDFGIRDRKELSVLLEKAAYIQEDYAVLCGERPAALFYAGPGRCLEEESVNLHKKQILKSGAFTDLSHIASFRSFMSGGFDARFFNELQGDEFVVTKRSENIDKIKSEYNYYHMLPDAMKMWFVMPFDYREEGNAASYAMERYHMTDIAIRYVHGAVGEEEFRDILDKLFYFISHRQSREASEKEYRDRADALYVEKLEKRMDMLREHPAYNTFDGLVRMGTEYQGINQVVDFYKKLYYNLINTRKEGPAGGRLVVGHGDLCFSNILYQRDASVLKLIDPKGAMSEEELYTHPYYDLAKLSHSICGGYDFFNSGLFQITVEDGMRLKLSVDFHSGMYQAVFREYLAKSGYDYVLVRLCEASLFLSMLPLHMDQEHKAFAFLLNGIRIMEELKEYVKDA